MVTVSSEPLACVTPQVGGGGRDGRLCLGPNVEAPSPGLCLKRTWRLRKTTQENVGKERVCVLERHRNREVTVYASCEDTPSGTLCLVFEFHRACHTEGAPRLSECPGSQSRVVRVYLYD